MKLWHHDKFSSFHFVGLSQAAVLDKAGGATASGKRLGTHRDSGRLSQDIPIPEAEKPSGCLPSLLGKPSLPSDLHRTHLPRRKCFIHIRSVSLHCHEWWPKRWVDCQQLTTALRLILWLLLLANYDVSQVY